MKDSIEIGKSFRRGNLGKGKPILMKLDPIVYFISDGKLIEYNTATEKEEEIEVPLL